MSREQKYPIEEIIQQLPTHENTKKDISQKIFPFNPKTRTVRGRNILGNFYRGDLLYQVQVDKSILIENLPFSLKQVGYRNPLELELDASLKIELGSEISFIQRLFAKGTLPKSPKVAFKELLQSWISDFHKAKATTDAECLGKFTTYFGRLESHLIDEAELIGIRLKPKFQVKNHEHLKSLNVKSKAFFPIKLYKDKEIGNKEPIQISFDTRLKVSETYRALASMSYLQDDKLRDRLIPKIEERIIDYLLEERIGFDSFFPKISEDLTNDLQTVISKMVQGIGRKVTFFGLNQKDSNQEFVETARDTQEFKVELSNCKIKIENKFSIILDDKQKARKGKALFQEKENLIKWAKKIIKQTVRNNMLKKSYASLFFEFEEVKSDIESEIEDVLSQNGYKVVNIFTNPKDVNLGIFENGFDVNIGEGKSYPTRENDIVVKVRTNIQGKLGDPMKIQGYIHPDKDITSEIKDVAEREIGKLLRVIDLEDYFMNFTKGNTEKASVQMQIVKSVKKALSKKFKAKELRITPDQVPDSLMARYKWLRSKTHELTFLFYPSKNEDFLAFRMRYEINGIGDQSWPKFKNKDYSSNEAEIEEVNEILEDHLRQIISQGSVSDLENGAVISRLCEAENGVFDVIRSYRGYNLQFIGNPVLFDPKEELDLKDKISQFLAIKGKIKTGTTLRGKLNEQVEMENLHHIQRKTKLLKKLEELEDAGYSPEDTDWKNAKKQLEELEGKLEDLQSRTIDPNFQLPSRREED